MAAIDYLSSGDRDPGAGQQFPNPGGSAGQKTGGITQHQLADIHRVEAVHVLLREHRGIHHGGSDLGRQRGLDKNSVQMGIGIEPCQKREHLGLSGRFRQDMRLRKNAQLGAGLFLPAHIHLRCGVFADSNKCQARLETAPLEGGDPLGQLPLELCGNSPPVNKVCRRHYSPT